MGLILLIVVIVVVYLKVIKPKKQSGHDSHPESASFQSSSQNNIRQSANHPTRGVNRVPADALINSPYYDKYKNVFDLVWYDGNQAKYKIDWLLESLDMGRELENSGYYVIESIKSGFPYFCETESEYDKLLDKDKPVLRGSVEGILDLALGYGFDETSKHPSKMGYWKQKLIDMASSGNMEAQAALCAAKSNVYKALFSQDELNGFYSKYYNTLVSAAKSGNPYALIGVGQFLTGFASKQRRDLLSQAAKANLSDAWYYLGKAYSSLL